MFEPIHPDTQLGPVSLTVSDLDRSLKYYEQSLGFELHRREANVAHVGAIRRGTDTPLQPLLILTELKGARHVRGMTGLYHFAVRVPSKPDLALVFRRLSEKRAAFAGFADHLVSEAIYLTDPDGIGIEVYYDRDRRLWQLDAGGHIRMATDPFDVDKLIDELPDVPYPWHGLHPQTRIGHVHLQVAALEPAEAFYRDVLGFGLMARYGSAAAFLAAGGYHHHIGINTWAGVGAPPPPHDAAGLRWFSIWLPDTRELDRVLRRLEAAAIPTERHEEAFLVRDPSDNGIMLGVAPTSPKEGEHGYREEVGARSAPGPGAAIARI